MKACIIATSLLVGLSTLNLPVSSQTWIGDAFRLDTTITPAFASFPSDCFHLYLFIQGNILFFTDQKAFQNGESDYAAHICALSLQDYSTFEFDLPFPSPSENKDWLSKTFWIKDLCLQKDLCAISVQNQILLYHKTTETTFEYDTTINHPNVYAVYFHHGCLYYLEENHDTGYLWFQFDFKNGEETLVRKLPYEAPHVVQASPNRYLFHDESNLYFLSTRQPIVSRYNLDGRWLEDILFDLPDWHPFEDEYIKKSLEVPYGVERIFATKDQIFKYSYLKAIFPIADRYLIYYTQYDTATKKSVPMFAIADSTGHSTLYSRKCPLEHVFSDHRFPFNLFQPLEDLARTSHKNFLFEITADCDVSWHNLTFDEYGKRKEEHFRQHEPVIKIRIMSLKDVNMNAQGFFLDSQNKSYSLDDLSNGKHVFIIHGGLECSACANYLYDIMSLLDSNKIHLDILYEFIPGALQERELHRSIRQHVHRPYNLHYLDLNHYSHYPDNIIRHVNRYPAVLLYETGKAPIIFSNEDIFDDDPYSFRLSEKFQEFLDSFTSK